FAERDAKTKARNESLLANEEAKLDRLIADYERAISTDTARSAFARFENAYANYRDSRAAMRDRSVDVNDAHAAREGLALDFQQRFETVFKAMADATMLNHERATTELDGIIGQVRTLLTANVISFAV